MSAIEGAGRRPLLRFVNVEKRFGEDGSALRGMDLDVYPGEFLTLLGPSGAGKSTALMMVAGFESPSSGDILYKGRSLADIPAHQRNFGVVFQSRALFPHLSALHNVAYPLRMRGISKSEALKRAHEALALVRLAPLESQLPAHLARGEQQRIALARALVFEPEVVLMDEPLGALDVGLAHQMQAEIHRLHEELGNTVLYVTQDHSEAIALSDRIAILHDGAIQQIDSPQALYEGPETAFVAEFIGETNMLQGTVTSQSEDLCQVTLDTGEEVTATPVNVSGAGARTRLSVRPERLIVNPGAELGANRFQATATGLSFRGDHSLANLQLMAGSHLVAKIPHPEADTGLAVGATVEVGWHPQHCRALDPPS